MKTKLAAAHEILDGICEIRDGKLAAYSLSDYLLLHRAIAKGFEAAHEEYDLPAYDGVAAGVAAVLDAMNTAIGRAHPVESHYEIAIEIWGDLVRCVEDLDNDWSASDWVRRFVTGYLTGPEVIDAQWSA